MKNEEIWTCDRLVIKPVIPCQRIDSTQKFKLLDEVLRYDLYYSLISFLFSWFFKKKNGLKKAIFYSPKAHTFLLTGLSMLKRVDFELWRNMFGLLIAFWSEAKRHKKKRKERKFLACGRAAPSLYKGYCRISCSRLSLTSRFQEYY